MRAIYFWLLFAIVAPVPATAQEDIETDRPDQTETTAIVPKGFFQMETGFMHEGGKTEDMILLPTALHKYGITNRFEIRLQTDFTQEADKSGNAYGLNPVLIGTKFNILKNKGLQPEISFIAMALLPRLASKEFQANHVAPQLKLLFENKVTDYLDIDYNLDTEWDGNSSRPQFEITFAPQFEFSKKLKGFIEGFSYLQNHRTADHWVDTGFMFLLTCNIQLDIAGGYELTSHNNYHDFFETVGISFRI